MIRLWEEVSDNRRKWSNVVRKILIVCVTNSQGCWMTSQIRVNHHCRVQLYLQFMFLFHHLYKLPPLLPGPGCLVLGPAKISISQVVAGYFSRAGRGAAAAPGHWKITYHASSALASADPLLLSWSCSPHRSTVWRSHSIPDPHHVPPGPAPGAGCGLLLGPGRHLRQAAELAR